jgi:hypothetical protein
MNEHAGNAEPVVDLNEAEAAVDLPEIGSRERYDALMKVIENRVTVRAFDPDFEVPREHFEMILEAARHAPSGANAQPWHFIVVTDPELKQEISSYFVEEQRRRAKLKMKFPTPDYRGLATAPGFIVVATDFAGSAPSPCSRTTRAISTACTRRMPSASCCNPSPPPPCRRIWPPPRSATMSGGSPPSARRPPRRR